MKGGKRRGGNLAINLVEFTMRLPLFLGIGTFSLCFYHEDELKTRVEIIS
jgi:hypothetical protein